MFLKLLTQRNDYFEILKNTEIILKFLQYNNYFGFSFFHIYLENYLGNSFEV